MQGARLVSCLGGPEEEEEEYAADFEEEPAETEEVAANTEEHPNTRIHDMDACFTDAILGSSDPDGPSASGAYGTDADAPFADQGGLIEQLKIEMRDTFVFLFVRLHAREPAKEVRTQRINCLFAGDP